MPAEIKKESVHSTNLEIMAGEKRHDITYALVDKIEGRMPPVSSNILVKVESGALATNSGIFIPNNGEWDLNAGLHARRHGIVVAKPDKLAPRVTAFLSGESTEDDKKKNTEEEEQKRPYWDAELDIEVGDEVLFDHMAALESPMVKEKSTGDMYRIIPFQYMMARRRNGEIVGLNGNVLCADVTKTEKAGFYEKEEVDDRFGIVKHLGKPNKSYTHPTRSDKGVDLEIGDKVLFSKSFLRRKYYLEDEMHWKFSKDKLFIAQMCYIDYVMEEA